MAGTNAEDLHKRLQKVRIRGEVSVANYPELEGRQVEVTIQLTVGSELVRVEATPRDESPTETLPTPTSSTFVLSPLAESRLGRQRIDEPGTKVLGPKSINYWGWGSGFNCLQTLKGTRRTYVSPKPRQRGFVSFRDFIVEGEVLTVKNQGLRSHAEWVSRAEFLNLPLYSLVFSDFRSKNYSFCSIWHKELTGWLERAATAIDISSGEQVDYKIAETIYQPAKPGSHVAWKYYLP